MINPLPYKQKVGGFDTLRAHRSEGRSVVQTTPPSLHLDEYMGMTIIMVMEETLPLAEIKAHLSAVVDRIESHHARITLTRNGKAAAVLISPDDLAALEETLDILSDPKAVAGIRKAREAIARGKGLTADQLKQRYLRS